MRVIHWFRRDLRIHDNVGLALAARHSWQLLGVWNLDPRWFHPDTQTIGPYQATYWLDAVRELSVQLKALGIPLILTRNADPVAALLAVAKRQQAEVITYNKEYEPEQVSQDLRLERQAQAVGVRVHACKDASIFEEQEILTGKGDIYCVFTAYKNNYLKRLAAEFPTSAAPPLRNEIDLTALTTPIPLASSLGFARVTLATRAGETVAARLLQDFTAGPIYQYQSMRDIPSAAGTSGLSPALNAGTVSLRQCMIAAQAALVRAPVTKAAPDQPTPKDSVACFTAELIWREFYRMILFNFPQTVSQPFQDQYLALRWGNRPEYFQAWAQARTGYPIVDAAMRQLLTTGLMHNRLRMISAMFLTKDLDVHWTQGEKFFQQWLMDYDQACNVGGWQWSASTGTDAAPYFRIMNPTLQGQRYDPQGRFVRQYLPALLNVPDKYIHCPWLLTPAQQQQYGCVIGRDYPAPIVDHNMAKEAAIKKFVAIKPRPPRGG